MISAHAQDEISSLPRRKHFVAPVRAHAIVDVLFVAQRDGRSRVGVMLTAYKPSEPGFGGEDEAAAAVRPAIGTRRRS